MMLAIQGVSKAFAGHQVLEEVSFKVESGTCVAVIGENGAGKSTLAKCLVGVHQPDTGSITLDGRTLRLTSPRAAQARGIAFLPQELAYVPEMSVAENLVLGNWPSAFGFTRRSEIHKLARTTLASVGVAVSLKRRMSSLTLGERQLVEIAKSLLRRSKVLVLDEPTAALAEDESQKLFDVIKSLTQTGVTVIFISHRMDEVHRFAESVHIMRNGRLVATVDPRKASKSELVEHMLGASPKSLEIATTRPDEAQHGRPLAIGLRRFYHPGPPPIEDLSLDVYAGEILGVFGVRGSGADTIAESLGGKHTDALGVIEVDGQIRPLFHDPISARRAGVAYVPQERKRDGIILGMSVKGNLTLTILRCVSHFGFLNRSAGSTIARSLVDELSVRATNINQLVGELSGGNQQKVLLASRLATNPRILVLHEPTRGVDVGARLDIHTKLRSLARRGIASVLVSSDIEEVADICDRVMVMRDGCVAATFERTEISQQELLRTATREVAKSA